LNTTTSAKKPPVTGPSRGYRRGALLRRSSYEWHPQATVRYARTCRPSTLENVP
jgi:hypothetical protein